jgi:hypothetical protein
MTTAYKVGDTVLVTDPDHPFFNETCIVRRRANQMLAWPDDLLWLKPAGAGDTITFRVFANQVSRQESHP